jgi:hypothetical protein
MKRGPVMHADERPTPTSSPVVDAIANGTVDDLTTADVLTSLEAVGIRSLEDLATRWLEKVRQESRPRTRNATAINPQMLRRSPGDSLEATIEHRVPQVPFIWNGGEHEPEEIHRFNGKAIAYLPIQTASGDMQVQIVDDTTLVRQWLEFRYVNTRR